MRASPGSRAGLWRVVSYDIVDVCQSPAGGGHVHGEQMLLAAETVPDVESTANKNGRPPRYRAAGQEAQHRRAGKRHIAAEGTVSHRLAGRVETTVWLDHDAGRDQAKPRVRLECIGRTAQRPRRPPRIVVTE